VILERVVRTGRTTGLRIDNLLATVLVAELVSPSRLLWLVSPWISDVQAIDNTTGGYDSLFVDASNRLYQLSETLALLTHSGATLHVVTRSDSHNDTFLARLQRLAKAENLLVVQDDDVHEKTFCGDDWLLTGSMNLTIRGMRINDEAVTYKINPQVAANTRLDLRRRFGTKHEH
jgi:phosphatidylserine/phosphatidylglycerophosphate/cardiolipin synthase-like enzyme